MRKLLLLITLTSPLVLAEGLKDISFNSIGLNIGKAYSSSDKKDKAGSITLGNTPDESFNSFELYTTLDPITELCKKNDIKPYLSFTYSDNDELKHSYLLFGINKYYTPVNSKFKLYAGALLGYGQMDWEYDPLNTSKVKNMDADSLIAGIQGGISYPLSSKISLSLNTKYLLHDYKTDLDPSTGVSSDIEHKGTALISLGVSYSF